VYSLAVYFLHNKISPTALIAVALFFIGVRISFSRSAIARLWRLPLGVAIVALVAIAFLNQVLATKAYPVAMSLAAAATFAMTLRCPPSLIERFARIRRPELPPEAVGYCRRMTVVWVAWLTVNGFTAAILAMWGSLDAWALWTGLLSYIGTGMLIIGEIVYRRLVLERRQKR
jgi:uncharacterized membrane protein